MIANHPYQFPDNIYDKDGFIILPSSLVIEKIVDTLFSELCYGKRIPYQCIILNLCDDTRARTSFSDKSECPEMLESDIQVWRRSEQKEIPFWGEYYYFSPILSYPRDSIECVVLIHYSDEDFDEFTREYIKFIVDRFLRIIALAPQDQKDFSKNYIRTFAREFVEMKISRPMLSITSFSVMATVEMIEAAAASPYEGAEMSGKFLATVTEMYPEYEIEFADEKQVELCETQKIRKLLEVTYRNGDDGLFLVRTNTSEIRGFSKPQGIVGPYLLIEFKGRGTWSIRSAQEDKISQEIEFRDYIPHILTNADSIETRFKRVYKAVFERDCNDAVWTMVVDARKQVHGTMLVFVEDAPEEAERLKLAGFPIRTCPNEYLKSVTSIDGAVLVSPDGMITSIGVILDGIMAEAGFDTSRGARYNSAIKYSAMKKDKRHLIVVISEDGYVNFITGGVDVKQINRKNIESIMLWYSEDR